MLTLEDGKRILEAAFRRAEADGAAPLAVMVLDAGAHPVTFARQDGASHFRYDIARAKARSALGMGVDTRVTAEKAKAYPAFYLSVAAATEGGIALSPGGVLLRASDGTIRGAIGISGDTGDMDEICALAGLEALNKEIT